MAGQLSSSIKVFFVIVYMIFLVYNLVMFLWVFINPKVLKWILIHLTSMGFLKRWRRPAYQLSKDILVTSHEFRKEPPLFWCKMLICTLLTLMVRYILINCLIAAYCPVSLGQHLATCGRQVVMWVFMLPPVSPSGSCIAEFWFQKFFEPILGHYTLWIVVLWRTATFYLLLILGAMLLPKWVQKAFKIAES